MDRKQFAQKLMALGVCPFALSPFLSAVVERNVNNKISPISGDKEFVEQGLSTTGVNEKDSWPKYNG